MRSNSRPGTQIERILSGSVVLTRARLRGSGKRCWRIVHRRRRGPSSPSEIHKSARRLPVASSSARGAPGIRTLPGHLHGHFPTHAVTDLADRQSDLCQLNSLVLKMFKFTDISDEFRACG